LDFTKLDLLDSGGKKHRETSSCLFYDNMIIEYEQGQNEDLSLMVYVGCMVLPEHVPRL
jgi:hypothetical protein